MSMRYLDSADAIMSNIETTGGIQSHTVEPRIPGLRDCRQLSQGVEMSRRRRQYGTCRIASVVTERTGELSVARNGPFGAAERIPHQPNATRVIA